MFFCLRALTLLAPVAVVAGIVWLAGQARQFSYRADSDLVVAVREMPARFNPLMPGAGAEREITELLFDRLLRLDDDLRLRAHLLDRWEYQHRATCFFTDADTAKAGAELLAGRQENWNGWGLFDPVLDGDQIHLVSSRTDTRWLEEIVNGFAPESLASLLHVKLTLRSAVAQSLADFLSGSVEKNQIRHLDYEGDRVAHLYLLGETDLFLKELRLYYESNLNLEPTIEVMGPVNRLSELDFDMELREGITWHDGVPVTADDLVFTFEEITRPGSPWPLRQAFDFVESVERIDEHRVRAHCHEFYAPALERWGKLPLLPAHLLRQAMSEEDWEGFFANPIGNGPYRVAAGTGESEVVLRSFADYFRGVPRQQTVRYRQSVDDVRRRRDWQLGLIDALSPTAEERTWFFDRRTEPGIEAQGVRDVGRFQSFVAWNLDRPQFADPRVRRALGHLVDLDAFLETATDLNPMPWDGLFFPGSWFCPVSTGPLPPGAALAKSLLTEAGWTRDDRVGWQTQEGQVVDLTLSYHRADPLHSRLAEWLAGRWERAGIRIQLEPLDWADLLEKRLAPREFDALLLSWELDFSRDHFAVWHSTEAGPGGTNFSGLRNQQVDSLLEKLRTTEGEPRVIELATELQNQIRELQPCLFLCSTGRELAVRSGAVEQARPGPESTWIRGPVTVGRSGLYASRPWWVRVIPPSEPSAAPPDPD